VFRKLLVANRGEIACRIVRTARRLGVATVAVFSDADAEARHVREADAAIRIGPAPARDSYLKIDRLIAAARESGADAVHPGYGFLSENPAFAEACAAAAVAFIGPPAAAIRAMGSKADARALMITAGVPVVPGYEGSAQDDATLAHAAERIGFPVLLKPAMGGGGKGMHRVDDRRAIAEAVAATRREATSSFGDAAIVIEKFVERPRHVEVQVLLDRLGHAVHLWERDCSTQRRHQKVVEEAPATLIPTATRQAMRQAALAAARAVGYVNAGTVEFLVGSEGAFYFMEMNTRLQVEHPVTEMITGLDLVEWQLRIAAGEPLPFDQTAIGCAGHAIEARIYAEAPERDFLPWTGRLRAISRPDRSALRWDSGFEAGDTVTPFYDPMIGKMIAHGADREAARRVLLAGLAELRVEGVATNTNFLIGLVGGARFGAGQIDVQSLDRDLTSFLPDQAPTLVVALASAAITSERNGKPTSDPWSPQGERRGWWLNLAAEEDLSFRVGESNIGATLCAAGEALLVEVDGRRHLVERFRAGQAEYSAIVDDTPHSGLFRFSGGEITLEAGGGIFTLTVVDLLGGVRAREVTDGAVVAPVPGKVVQVRAAVGAAIERGQPLVVVEAMKMEHTVVAPRSGIVRSLAYREGDFVSDGAVLAEIAESG
jgi:3-methylcrotonyl-CoA carboxylase alpha subunit